MTAFILSANNIYAQSSLVIAPSQGTVVPGGNAVFCAEGGAAPYNWSFRGVFAQMSVSGNCATVITESCFCKKAYITVRDTAGQSIEATLVNSQGGWRLIESSADATQITSVRLPVPASERSGSYLSSIINDELLIQQSWRFNGSRGSSSPASCNNVFPLPTCREWDVVVGVFPTKVTDFNPNYNENDWTAPYPYEPWVPFDHPVCTGPALYAAIDNAPVCGNNGYGNQEIVATPTGSIMVYRWECPNQTPEQCSIDPNNERSKNLGEKKCEN